ncbi:hypothetical protein KAS08_02760 [Candidatus Pacearchaeota archaeon]|nr:hypothetical protein [Candidatus Pacearchaeota archaeon]
MNKLSLILLGLVLMFGLVSADNVLSNVTGIDIPTNIIAGSPFEASFSFDYAFNGENTDDSPLIIKLNIISEENETYPVMKGDFQITGRVEKSWFFNTLTKTVEFNCSEEYNQTIEHPLDAQNVTAPDGTFYCYNVEGDLDLNEHDNIYLDIISHQALYPGEYNFSAELFYLTDERAPFVNITNKDMFKQYYREVDNIIVSATIEDGSEISVQWGNVFLGYENLTIPYTYDDEDVYYFSRNTPVDIMEGNYPLYVFAEDIYNNTGSDNTVLKIDRTAPDITLNQSIGIVGDVLPVFVNIVDEKSGVDNSSVEYRLREMFGFSPCPESGVGTFTCYNSGWVTLPNIEVDLFGDEINTSELNGDFWLEVRASDILGNSGEL